MIYLNRKVKLPLLRESAELSTPPVAAVMKTTFFCSCVNNKYNNNFIQMVYCKPICIVKVGSYKL